VAEKNRIRNLSTRWLVPFKVVVFGVYTALCLTILFAMVHDRNNWVDWVFGLGMAVGYIHFFFRLMRVTSKLHRVEFDNQFLYVLQRKQDILIPLENIESVEISTLGGVYKVNLYHPEQIGDSFYFKLSLWYPLNYQSKDALVNVLRKNIDVAKARKQEFPRNALHS
jgi:hypothetical protein